MTNPSTPTRKRIWRVLGVTGVVLAAMAMFLAVVAVVTFFVVFRVARVEGQAMSPTLRDQDRLAVYKLAYSSTTPQRGDIVMMRYPRDPSKIFVKRVIAQGGDRLQIHGGRVELNGQPIDDSYVVPEFRSMEDWGPALVPEGTYFVMGDRRNNSADSRHWGFVPANFILGRITLRWWPLEDARWF